VLAGFSQGCAMTLMTGLRHAEGLAGLLCMSGYLPLADKTAAERSAANQNTPIFLAHGRHDPVVPMSRALTSRDALNTMAYAIDWHEYEMEHSLCAEEITDIEAWLCKVLA
jgi:phospholipase/carboxylesterase